MGLEGKEGGRAIATDKEKGKPPRGKNGNRWLVQHLPGKDLAFKMRYGRRSKSIDRPPLQGRDRFNRTSDHTHVRYRRTKNRNVRAPRVREFSALLFKYSRANGRGGWVRRGRELYY